jgi:DNA-binding winged helix-turn-helix (wHTH) protein
VRVRFGPFTVNVQTRQLFRDNSEIHLSPKAFDLLCSLIERRPRVIEKTELLGHIWPDTFVVDASLNVLIGEIRRALTDDARQPRYVRTVHGVGYAFCGDARDADEPIVPTRAVPRGSP